MKQTIEREPIVTKYIEAKGTAVYFCPECENECRETLPAKGNERAVKRYCCGTQATIARDSSGLVSVKAQHGDTIYDDIPFLYQRMIMLSCPSCGDIHTARLPLNLKGVTILCYSSKYRSEPGDDPMTVKLYKLPDQEEE